jgi:hypothetical protein
MSSVRSLQWVVLAPAYAALNGAPARGWVRVVAHADQAMFLAYPAALGALTLWIYIKRRPWPLAIGYTMSAMALMISYPAIRGDAIRQAYLAFQLACLTVAVGAFLHWIAFRKDPPTASHLVVGLMMIVEIANVAAGPWRLGFFTKWDMAQMTYCMLYAMLILIQSGWLWTIKTSSLHS